MANGTIAFDTLTTSDQVNTGTEKSIDTSYLLNGSAKHWTFYNQISETVFDSFNQSSVTDNTGGDYATNFTNSFSNVFYGSTGAGQRQHSSGRGNNALMIDSNFDSSDALTYGVALATGSRAYLTGYGSTAAANGGQQDQVSSVASHGDLA
jgi:hypothetical protein